MSQCATGAEPFGPPGSKTEIDTSPAAVTSRSSPSRGSMTMARPSLTPSPSPSKQAVRPGLTIRCVIRPASARLSSWESRWPSGGSAVGSVHGVIGRAAESVAILAGAAAVGSPVAATVAEAGMTADVPGAAAPGNLGSVGRGGMPSSFGGPIVPGIVPGAVPGIVPGAGRLPAGGVVGPPAGGRTPGMSIAGGTRRGWLGPLRMAGAG